MRTKILVAAYDNGLGLYFSFIYGLYIVVWYERHAGTPPHPGRGDFVRRAADRWRNYAVKGALDAAKQRLAVRLNGFLVLFEGPAPRVQPL